MTEQEMIKTALELGFHRAVIVDTKDLVFEPFFRTFCEDNKCGQYGKNYSCPPDCGTVEEMKNRILAYPKALALESVGPITDPMDSSQIKPLKSWHNKATRTVLDKIGGGLMCGASGCTLCAPCALTQGEPCRFPDKAWSCLSAYCVHVQKLAETCGMDYVCGNGVVSFYSLCCFRPE